MKVKVYKAENGANYHIGFTCDYNPDTASAMEVSCDEETLRDIYQQLGEIFAENETKEEMVWNPRSQRHEIVRK